MNSVYLKDSFDEGVQRKRSRVILRVLSAPVVWMVVLFPGTGPGRAMGRETPRPGEVKLFCPGSLSQPGAALRLNGVGESLTQAPASPASLALWCTPL